MNDFQRQRILETAIVHRHFETLEETASRLKSMGLDVGDTQRENDLANSRNTDYYDGYEAGAKEMLRVFGYRIVGRTLVKL